MTTSGKPRFQRLGMGSIVNVGQFIFAATTITALTVSRVSRILWLATVLASSRVTVAAAFQSHSSWTVALTQCPRPSLLLRPWWIFRSPLSVRHFHSGVTSGSSFSLPLLSDCRMERDDSVGTMTNPSSVQELRRLRLAALSHTNSNNSDNKDDDEDETPRNVPRHGSSSTVSSSRKRQATTTQMDGRPAQTVIDLCSSDKEEDDETNDDDSSVIDVTVEHQSKKARSNKIAAVATKKKPTALPHSPTTQAWLQSGGCFKLCTYNVWFGPHQRDGSPFPVERMTAIVDLLQQQHDEKTSPLWFVGFQELVDPLVRVLDPLLRQANFYIIQQPLYGILPYGVALAIRQTPESTNNNDDGCVYPQILQQGWVPYTRTRMDRGFVYAHCQYPANDGTNSDEECLVATTHLESYLSPQDNGASTRALQIQELQEFCRDQMQQHAKLKTAVIMGDLNWDDESRKPSDDKLLSVLGSSWKDAWLETNTVTAQNKGYTYDSKLNPMLGGNLRRRFDRCLVLREQGGDKKGTTSTNIQGTELIGQEALADLTWPKLNPYTQTTREMPAAPSDHFGLVTTLSSSAASASGPGGL